MKQGGWLGWETSLEDTADREGGLPNFRDRTQLKEN